MPSPRTAGMLAQIAPFPRNPPLKHNPGLNNPTAAPQKLKKLQKVTTDPPPNYCGF